MSVPERTKKVCLVGDFGVGKTSIVARFVNQSFSDKYLTTVGVSIKTKLVDGIAGSCLKLIIWDIAGNSTVTSASERYVRGSDGFLLVADGTRRATLETAFGLAQDVTKICGPIPYVCLLNKRDLGQSWAVDASDEQAFAGDAMRIFHTSAKSGENVNEAFEALAQALSA